MAGEGEGPYLRGWRKWLPDDPWLTTCIAIPAALVITGLVLLIYGAGQTSEHTMGNGGDFLFFAFFLAAPLKIGWWLKGRERKISVEEKLDVVQEGLDRVEGLLTGATVPDSGPVVDAVMDAVVRPLRR